MIVHRCCPPKVPSASSKSRAVLLRLTHCEFRAAAYAVVPHIAPPGSRDASYSVQHPAWGSEQPGIAGCPTVGHLLPRPAHIPPYVSMKDLEHLRSAFGP